MQRRNFIKFTLGGIATSIVLDGLPVRAYANNFFDKLVYYATENDKVLVLIQLVGGNDGLNTVIPLDRYEILSNVRKSILIPEKSIIKLTDSTGLHPAMTGLQRMFAEGKLGIANAVGYPKPNFSHFRSTDIWTTASDSDKYLDSGWLYRYYRENHPNYPKGYPNETYPDPLTLTIGSVVSDTCQGPLSPMGMAIPPSASIYNIQDAGTDVPPDSYAGEELEYIRSIIATTKVYNTRLREILGKGTNISTRYPKYGTNKLADQLKLVAKLLSGGIQTKVFVCSLGGFDTHSGQVTQNDPTVGAHANLLGFLSEAIDIFQEDIELMNLSNRVVGFTFSEFGRRIIANSSFGTDHGSAAPMFFFGTQVNPIIHGSSPVLPEKPTVNDNIPMQFDFRSVYYSLLKDWFNLDESLLEKVLLKKYEYIPIIKTTTFAENIDTNNINIYPNPADSYFNIQFDSQIPQKIELYDIRGKLIFADNNPNESTRINTVGYPSGRYLVNIIYKNKKQTQPLIIEH